MAPVADPMTTVLAKLEELGQKMDVKAEEVSRKLEEVQLSVQGVEQSLQRVMAEQEALATWKPKIETTVTQLKNSVYDVKTKVDFFIHSLPRSDSEIGNGFVDEALAPAHLGANRDYAEAPVQFGHSMSSDHRGIGAGVVTTLVPPPVKGTPISHNYSPASNHDTPRVGSLLRNPTFASVIPQVNFSRFDGTNPRIWKKQCESFFNLYDVPKEMWVKLAIMHFDSSAVFWL